ncbi:MAG: PAS domain-containing protein [Pseudomonadota bacterium]
MYTLQDRTAVDLLGDAGTLLRPGALRALSDCVMMLDGTGRISQISRGSMAAMELGPENTVIGQAWPDLWPLEARGPLREAVARSLDGHITKYWSSYLHPDGAVSQWDIRLSPVRDAASAVTSVIAVSRQVTAH